MNNVMSLTGRRGNPSRVRVASRNITRIFLLGATRALDHPGGKNILPASRKTQAVFALLCLAQGERVLRSRIAGLIWDRSAERQARDSLRHALRELDGIGTWRLESDHETVRLDTSACWIDALENPAEAEALLEDLHGVSASFDQWLVGERVRFENRWLATLEETLNGVAADNASPELRAAAARRLLNFVPAHEIAVRSLMTAFVEMGDRAQAIREYERFRLLMKATHGILPSEETVALYQAIRHGSPVRYEQASARPRGDEAAADAKMQRKPDPTAIPAVKACGSANRPSIAVLPFRNLSIEAGHDYVAEGLTDDLIETLSRIRSLFVISRLSTATFRNQDRPIFEVGEALGVRYLLSGSIRVAGDRLRLMAELTDARTGAALWVSRFDENMGDLLDAQDRLAQTVVRSVVPHVRSAELKRVRTKRPENQDAFDLFLRAQEGMHSPSREAFEASEHLFELAIAREPAYAAALAWRAYWHVLRVGQGWSPDPARDADQAEHFAALSVECDATEPMAFAVQGHVATYLHKNFERAFSCFKAALRINPNGARAWLWNANAHAYLGEGAQAVKKVNRALALSPFDPLEYAYTGGASLAYLADRQYDRAIEFALRSIHENPSYTSAYKLLIAASVLGGREIEAHPYVHQLLSLEPGFTVHGHQSRFPGSATAFGARYCDALAVAGVPLS